MHIAFFCRQRFRNVVRVFLASVVIGVQSTGTVLAGTTGIISGTVADAQSGLPVNNVTVNAVSPSASYSGKTDARGFYSFAGASPDTYTVSFQLAGYQATTSSGVSVFADQVATVNARLQRSLKTIGSVNVRSAGGAYQPSQTQDSYTVTSSQVNTLQGKSAATDEKSLLSRLPGASLDSSGYPVLRGGRENEEGYQFEGVDQTDAFVSLFVNSLMLDPSVSQLQLTPGPGDASVGNAGTGVINLVAKRGTYPAFGTLDLETVAQPYGRQLSFEYGIASPNGRFSNYFMYLGSRNSAQYGQRGGSAVDLSTPAFYNNDYFVANDIVDNLYYKFGKNNHESLQLFIQNQQVDSLGTYGGGSTIPYASADPYTAGNVSALTGLTQAQFQSLKQLFPGQSTVNQFLGDRGGYATSAPNSTIKLQYSNNVNASTYLTLRAYDVNGVQTIDAPYNQVQAFAALEHRALQGGIRQGTALDLTKQFGTKHLVQAGAKYEIAHPVFAYDDPLDGFFFFGGAFGDGSGELYDFINPKNPNPALSQCPIDPPSVKNPSQSYCGYLTRYLGPSPGPLPWINQTAHVIRQDYATYLTDTYSPSNRVKITGGLRLDGTNFQLPSTTGCNSLTLDTCPYLPTGFANGLPYTTVSSNARNPLIVEPRLAISMQLSKVDAVRASYGRSVQFPPISDVDASANPNLYVRRFGNIPSYDVRGAIAAGVPPGTPFPAKLCGVSGDRLCTSYADQLYWEDQSVFGVPSQPIKPETFNNFDFSYSHQFPHNIAVKVTPFYRRGYDAIALVSPIRLNPATGQPLVNPANGTAVFGAPISTNLGIDRTTGVEFQLTREAAYGLSGQLNATYINEFSNVVPTTPGEDFLPNIPPPSLALGNQYRVGFISPFAASLALSYRTHFGLRINPIVSYSRGYPIGAGNLVATQLNGQFINAVNTNVTAGSAVNGIAGSPSYVDPGNPGSVLQPNIIATRGTAEKSSPGGILSAPAFNTDLSIEFHRERSHSTVGVLITNLFNQLADNRAFLLNDRYQPVATGVAGPLTGFSQFPIQYPGRGIGQYTAAEFGSDPYRIINDNRPITLRFYYQLAL